MAEPAPITPESEQPADPSVGRWEPASWVGLQADAFPPLPKVREIGGRKEGPEPTRYGDWEKNGRCIDF